MLEGRVIKSTGSWYEVETTDGAVYTCRIVGKFRMDGIRITNPVAVGDRVRVELEAGDDTQGLIKEILPRANYVIRQSPKGKVEMHLMASNIDQGVVIATIVQPKLKQGFIDRFLLMLEPYEIPGVVVFNKADLYGEGEMNVYEFLRDIYVSIGYEVVLTSAVNGTGLEELRELFKGKISLISGQSGVGKSSLVNSIQPNLTLRTQDLSDYSGKGMHTTTFAEMYRLDENTSIIDTPGIKSLTFNHLEPQMVAHNFREFFALSEDCRFGGSCLHRNEPGCAVKAALEEGIVSPLRYENYLMILQEVEDQNYWERNKEF
ncbi:MAG: ribosome small subunit-dependent GTPase A [Saprospirales bacterium]|nr:ribosome small subunit-dependent GTPase A [Saprospirales bacterium]MBK8489885.1 ribosome small subunit-dependent GTPase A [Saprospirales bacterium]